MWEAFSRIDNWRLIVAGAKNAAAYRAWAHSPPQPATLPTLFEGFADESTRSCLYAACDIVVISFKRGKESDSGSLVDAIAWGKTIVCSDRCPSAEVVRAYGLGQVFEPGNVQSFIESLNDVPDKPDPEGLAQAREELSSPSIARQNIAALRSR